MGGNNSQFLILDNGFRQFGKMMKMPLGGRKGVAYNAHFVVSRFGREMSMFRKINWKMVF